MAVEFLKYLSDENDSAEAKTNTLSRTEKTNLRNSVKEKSADLTNSLLDETFSIKNENGIEDKVKLYDILKGIKKNYYPSSGIHAEKITTGGNVEFSIGSEKYSIGWNSELAAVIQSFLVVAGHGNSNLTTNKNNTFIDGMIGSATINAIEKFVSEYENKQLQQEVAELKQQANKKNIVTDDIDLGYYINNFKNTINSTKFSKEYYLLTIATQLNIVQIIEKGTTNEWIKLNYGLSKENLILTSQGKKYNIPIKSILSMNDNNEPYVDREKLKSAVINKLEKNIYPEYAEKILSKYKLEIEQTFNNRKFDINKKKINMQKSKDDFSSKHSRFVVNYHQNKNSVKEFNEWFRGKMNELNRTIEEQNRNEKIEKKRNEVISVLNNFNGNISDIITEVSPNLGHAKAQAYIKKFNNGKVKIIDIQKSTFNGRPTVSYKLYNDGKEYHSYVDTNFDKQYNEKIIKATIKKDID